MSIKNVVLGAVVLGSVVGGGIAVGANKWSYEAACWTNIAQYGMVRA